MAIWEIVVLQRNTAPLVEIRNIWYCGDLDAGPVAAEAAWGQLYAWYDSLFSTFLPVTWQCYGATRRDISLPGMPALDLANLGTIPGTIGLTVGMTQGAAVLNMVGATARPNRARKYIGPLAEQAITNSTLDTAVIATLDEWVDEFDSWQTAQAETGAAFLSVRKDPLDGTVLTANLLDAASYSIVPAALRSRKVGVGI